MLTIRSAHCAGLRSCIDSSLRKCARREFYDRIYMSFERHMKCGMGKCGYYKRHQRALMVPCSIIGKRRIFRVERRWNAKRKGTPAPRVVVPAWASCSAASCKLRMPNRTYSEIRAKSMCSIGKWPLAAPEPEVDVVIIEAASRLNPREIVECWRKRAKCLIAMGACAVCGGIPSIAAHHLNERAKSERRCAPSAFAGKCLLPAGQQRGRCRFRSSAHVLLIPPISLR